MKMLIAAFKKKAMRELEEQIILQQEERLNHRLLERGTQYRHRGRMRNSTNRGRETMMTVFQQVKERLVDKEEVRLDEREEKLDELRERPISKGNRTEAVLEEPKANTPIPTHRPKKAPSNEIHCPMGPTLTKEAKAKALAKATATATRKAEYPRPSSHTHLNTQFQH